MAGFADLAARLGELAQVPSRIAGPVAADINDALQEEFEGEHDPYGRPWAKLAESTVRRKGHDQILYETGALQNNTVARPTRGAGIEITSLPYGEYHQDGTSRMPARKILPDGANALPPEWQESIDRNTEQAFRKAMKK